MSDTFISDGDLKKMTRPKLQKELRKRGLSASGLKADLVERLSSYMASVNESSEDEDNSDNNGNRSINTNNNSHVSI